MPAYFVARVAVHDWDRFRAYQKGVIPSLKPFEGRVLAAGPGEPVEGEKPKDVNVIISFPSKEKIREWYESEGYQKIIGERFASSSADVHFVDGL